MPILVKHAGAALDVRLGEASLAMARKDPRYRYLGGLSHRRTRTLIARSDVLVHPSIMEGGANVIVEAITSGTPVIASRVPGNVGMLGRRYPGYFEVRDADGLARALLRVATDPSYLRALRAACAKRKPLFRPAAEARAVRGFVAALLA
jgi:glycosyltransferase involved in cell wall biosynthesis